MHDRVRRRGSPPSLLIASDRLRLLRRAGRVAGARRGRDGDCDHAARREREPRSAVSHRCQRVESILDRSKAAGARFFNCSPAEVVFGANMTTLNFALSRVLGRELTAGDEIIVTRLDHDGNVAPWVELADDLGLVVHHVDINSDSTLDLGDLESKLSDRTRVVVVPVGVERDRHARRRDARVRARARRRRDRLGRRRPLRRARGDGRARDRRRRRPVLAVQVLRAPPRDGVRPRVARRDVEAVQGASVGDDPDRAPLRDRHAALRAARRAARDVRLPRGHRREWTRSAATSARSASASSPG